MTRTWLFAALFGVCFNASAASAGEDALAEVLSLLRARVPDEAVRAYVEAVSAELHLTAEDVLALKEAGAEADLLVFLLERSWPGPPELRPAQGELIFESEGFRALRRRDAQGREVIVITNLAPNGRRLVRPPTLAPEPVEASEPRAEPTEPRGDEVLPSVLPPPLPPPKECDAGASPPPARTPSPWVRTPRGMVYVGPFYQFAPSNVPGPDSPWSPVFQIVPVFSFPAGYPYAVPAYPFARLHPVYPPRIFRHRYRR
ncbi:MAG: hypothetical protein ACE5JI_18820 [Acidobacteriota bacterium]